MRQETQNQMIREALEDGQSVTPIDALVKYGCFRLSGRIFELRQQGLPILTEIVEVKPGCKIARYSIPRADLKRMNRNKNYSR
jgi:hypothetical protein